MSIREVFSSMFRSNVDNKNLKVGQETGVRKELEPVITEKFTSGEAEDPNLISKPKFPTKTVIEEQKDGFLQDNGVIDSSKQVYEKTIPETDKMPPGTVGSTDGSIKLVGEEVRLKSGVTISEDPISKTVTITRNDGNDNPQTLAVLEDTALNLPKEESQSLFNAGLHASLSDNPLYAPANAPLNRPGEIGIRSGKMTQFINSDGTITLIDNMRGAMETRIPNGIPPVGIPAVLGTVGVMSKTVLGIKGSESGRWHSDTYTVSPDGTVKGTQHIAFPGIGSGYRKLEVTGKQLEDGTIVVRKGDDELYYKPFVSSKDVNQGS